MLGNVVTFLGKQFQIMLPEVLRQLSTLDRFPDGASRFLLMRAVAIATVYCKPANLFELLIHTAFGWGESDLPHTRYIDDAGIPR